MTTLRMYGTAPESIVDGPGLRFSVFVQGCTHHCPGCHNPESQPSDGGYLCEPADIVHEIHKNKLIHGVTLTAASHSSRSRVCSSSRSCSRLKATICGSIRDISSKILWQGTLMKKHLICLRFVMCSLMAPFVEALHSYDLNWAGSSNQRVIDLPATLKSGEVALWKQDTIDFEAPSSW